MIAPLVTPAPPFEAQLLHDEDEDEDEFEEEEEEEESPLEKFRLVFHSI